MTIGKRDKVEEDDEYLDIQERSHLVTQKSTGASDSNTSPKSSGSDFKQPPALTWHKNKKVSNVGAAVSSVFLLATCVMALFGNQGIAPIPNQELELETDFQQEENAFTNFQHRRLSSFDQMDNQILQGDEENEESDEDDEKKKRKDQSQKASKEDEPMADNSEEKNSNNNEEILSTNDPLIVPLQDSVDNKKCGFKLM